jgi:hypothetical protein
VASNRQRGSPLGFVDPVSSGLAPATSFAANCPRCGRPASQKRRHGPPERRPGIEGRHMDRSVDDLWQLSIVELLAAYDDARRRFVEKKLARDTQRARLEWLRAKAFAVSSGGVSERRYAVEASEDLARKGQELRETTRDLDLLKVDVDIIAMIARLRGASAGLDMKAEEPAEGDDHSESP